MNKVGKIFLYPIEQNWQADSLANFIVQMHGAGIFDFRANSQRGAKTIKAFASWLKIEIFANA